MKFNFFLIFLLVILLLVSGQQGCDLVEQTQTSQRILYQTTIVEVVDGDTVKTVDNETIRLLHVNTPEKGEKCYSEAKARLKELVENKTVWLERDMEDRDKYERKLRYIFLSPNTNPQDYQDFVNLIMIREGYASLLMIEPNTKYQQVFKTALNEASKEQGCIWRALSNYKDCFVIEQFHYDAEGDDCKNANDEYVTLKNICQDIEMKSWTIKDSSRKIYTFKDFTAKSNQSFTLYSGKGVDNETSLFWNSDLACQSVWNNDHDALFLRDSDGNLVLQYIY
ncbi:MAG: thermonuclease family protein [Candidatus Pacearchaeota archaeon]